MAIDLSTYDVSDEVFESKEFGAIKDLCEKVLPTLRARVDMVEGRVKGLAEAAVSAEDPKDLLPLLKETGIDLRADSRRINGAARLLWADIHEL